MSTQPEPAEQAENAIELKAVEGKSQGRIVRERFFHHRGAIVALVVLLLVALLGLTSIGFPVFGWYLGGWWQYNPVETMAVENPGGAPTLSMPWSEAGFAIGNHPFGQDTIGRDIFARTMKGVQTSLVIMVIVGGVATAVGVLVGALSGFFRGFTDTLLMRITDLFITMPLLVIGAVLGKLVGSPSAVPLALVLGLITWTTLARLVRGEFLTLREREFVDAARVAGASNSRIIFKHILPNAMGVVIVTVTLLMSAAILLETALSYLGFGIQEPTISLGRMISEYQSSFSTRPWLFWWPGLFIITIALCINFIGDGLRDAFDPRQKRLPSARAMARAARREHQSSSAIAP
ncbi:ABC transporter permease [Ruania suaedae]|uniref:ABC transporter permease n=1 Tax=Ruania suaedae TaxID=2897774 RepID=UPI001E574681|nr:ABC transporter permease [Ruania suaedae]UFU02291.1 ABC transporter permease [Ruania suaedae]